MRVAVIGGGINGVMSAWALALRGHSVDLFERGKLATDVSSASTKLLHGGLHYLERGQIGLVREALHERRWWMAKAPHLANPLELTIPIYKFSTRPKWMIRSGLMIYQWLGGNAPLGRWRWVSREETLRLFPELRAEGLQGAFNFYDGQIDHLALGLWAAEKAAAVGVRMHTSTWVRRISSDAAITVDGTRIAYDCVVNTAGPWARQLLDDSGIPAGYTLDLIRGSHIVLDRPCNGAFLLQVPNENRICFVLPLKDRTLVGNTEVRQELSAVSTCSTEEIGYLLGVNSYYFPEQPSQICDAFSGLRPLICSTPDRSHTTREYAIERHGKVVSVFGGHWSTARALSLRVAAAVSSQG